MLRQPIITVMGNVDAGKTQLLDTIRNTAVVESEPGRITQSIGCSVISIETIKKICGNLLEKIKLDIQIPGFVIIDTPGHAAFNNLRKRGGNLADIAIVVIDINEGVKPQTLECLEILRQYKTPFVIALNKVDLLQGWLPDPGKRLLENFQAQSQNTMHLLEKKLYEAVGKLSGLGFNSERFDRVSDYAKEIAIIPLSARTGEGIGEVFMVITGLSQRFLKSSLEIDQNSEARGTILEVKEEKGLGTTIDAIIHDGCLEANDTVVIGTLGEPLVVKVKALLVPEALSEMRDRKTKFMSVRQVYAATGVKISAPGLDGAVAGMPLRKCMPADVNKVKEEISGEVKEVVMDVDKQGIVIKADSLGSLEALIKLLKEKNVEIKKASIGHISKKDISDAESNYGKDALQCAILGFNVEMLPDVRPRNAKVICNNVIYKVIEEFESWRESERKRIESKETDFLVSPSKIEIMKGYVFRQNNPAIVGINVLGGTLKVATPLMKDDGIILTEVKSMQQEQESVQAIGKEKMAAVSLPNVTIGRQIMEGDILYSAVPEEHFRKFKEYRKFLTQEQVSILKDVAEIMRKRNPVWGV